jgi:tetrahydromethanopterin S-methyltransferase subunit F
MINKENIIESELPLYEVQEVTLLDAMLLLKRKGNTRRESSITRAAELIRERAQLKNRDMPLAAGR